MGWWWRRVRGGWCGGGGESGGHAERKPPGSHSAFHGWWGRGGGVVHCREAMARLVMGVEDGVGEGVPPHKNNGTEPSLSPRVGVLGAPGCGVSGR